MVVETAAGAGLGASYGADTQMEMRRVGESLTFHKDGARHCTRPIVYEEPLKVALFFFLTPSSAPGALLYTSPVALPPAVYVRWCAAAVGTWARVTIDQFRRLALRTC